MKAILIATLLVASAFCAVPETNTLSASFAKCLNALTAADVADKIMAAKDAGQACNKVHTYLATDTTAKSTVTDFATCKAATTAGSQDAVQACWDKHGAGMLKADGTAYTWTGFPAVVKCWELADAAFDTTAQKTETCKDINTELVKADTVSNQAAYLDAINTKANTCIDAAGADADKKTALKKCGTWYMKDALVAADGKFKDESLWVNTSVAAIKTCVVACTDKAKIIEAAYFEADCKAIRDFFADATNKKIADFTTYQADADKCKAKIPEGANARDCWAKCITASAGSAATTATATTTATTTTTTTTSAQSLVAVALVLLAFLF